MHMIMGVDEVGRGPLAGPVVAAAVILNPEKPIPGLKDSKLLSDKKRQYLADEIRRHALAYALGRAEVHEIDQLNIHHASLLAMQRAILALPKIYNIEMILIDGIFCPEVPFPCKAIIGGDKIEPVISAASILAKVSRDAEMLEFDLLYPDYGFSKHKGYPTKFHIKALMTYGVTDIHRRSYRPVKVAMSALS